jgi:ribosomal protein L15
MGFGRGRGFGGGRRGWRNMFYGTGNPDWMRFGGYGIPYGYPAPYGKPDPEFEKKALKNQAETLQAELALINKRLEEVEIESAAD